MTLSLLIPFGAHGTKGWILLQSVPISVQLKQYASVIAGLQKDLGADGAKTLISKSIFLVVSGSNDISVVFTSSSQISNYTQYIDLILEAYQNTLLVSLSVQLPMIYICM